MIARAAFLLGGAAGVVLAVSTAGTGLYIKGRIDGWAARVTAEHAELVDEMTVLLSDYQGQIAENQQDGIDAAGIVSGLQADIGGLRDDFDRIEGVVVCPVHPERRRVLDAARDAANAAARAARGEPDGAARADTRPAAGDE